MHRVAPLLPLGDRERQRLVGHGRHDVDERHLGDDGREQVRAQVGHRTHQQTAGAAAPDGEASGVV